MIIPLVRPRVVASTHQEIDDHLSMYSTTCQDRRIDRYKLTVSQFDQEMYEERSSMGFFIFSYL